MKTNRLSGGILVVAGMLLFAGCSSSAHIQKTAGANLSEYKTYSWIDSDQAAAAKPNRRKQIVEQNIRAAVDEQLQKSGWRVANDNPDVLVSSDWLVEKSNRKQQEAVYSQPYTRTYFNRFSGRFNSFYFPSQFVGYETYNSTVKEGTVTVTLIDAKTDKAVWQGWTTNELDRNQVTEKDIDKNVKSIFRKFDRGK